MSEAQKNSELSKLHHKKMSEDKKGKPWTMARRESQNKRVA